MKHLQGLFAGRSARTVCLTGCSRLARLARFGRLVPALALALLVACATPPPALLPPNLLHDELFAARPPGITATDLFALSEPMRRYVERDITGAAPQRDPRRTLIEALYNEGKLRLAYDGGQTLSAAQAFASRSGNCLSLVIMTAAFAHHLGLPVSYQHVEVGDVFTRQGDLILASGHVNLVLGRAPTRAPNNRDLDVSLIIDFLPQDELRGQRTAPLQEFTIVAMYMNNHAAEALGEGRLAEAYGWARQALHHDPNFLVAANTLGVIYARAGHGTEAEQVLRYIVGREPENTTALTNLVGLLGRGGRTADAQAFAERLALLRPVAPFHYFDLGRQAMAAGDPQRALALFKRELRSQPHQDEVHFWVAQAHLQLGEPKLAARHLREAMDHSDTQANHARYAAKLDYLRDSALR